MERNNADIQVWFESVSAYLSVCLPTGMSSCLPPCPRTCPSVCSRCCLFGHLYVYPPIHLSTLMSICPVAYLSLCPLVCSHACLNACNAEQEKIKNPFLLDIFNQAEGTAKTLVYNQFFAFILYLIRSSRKQRFLFFRTLF